MREMPFHVFTLAVCVLAEVQMWVFEEYVKLEDGKWIRPARGAQPPEGKTWVDEGYEPLTEVINRLNENVIYLPGIKLPKSIVAQPDIKKCVTGATMLVFVIPHNFLAPIVPKMEASTPNPAPNLTRTRTRTLTLALTRNLTLVGCLCPRRRGHLPHQGYRVQGLEAHPHLRPARCRDEEGTTPPYHYPRDTPYHATPRIMRHPHRHRHRSP